MRVDFLTIFPDLFTGFLRWGLIHQAREKGVLDVRIHDLREYTKDRHRSVDDIPYGGGPGMVFKPEPIFEAMDRIRTPEGVVILPSPQGKKLTKELAQELSEKQQLIFIAARYEGVDERVSDSLVNTEISVGDFVTMGGELPSLVILETVSRYIPGVIGQKESVERDSFEDSLLDYPHYTRPEEYRGMKVPSVLLSGHHEQIRQWRRRMALKRTLERRPDLLERLELSESDREVLEDLRNEKNGIDKL